MNVYNYMQQRNVPAVQYYILYDIDEYLRKLLFHLTVFC